ncbi:hypothetical protein C7212DRAFT_320376 [Tuber magnatum]|uniref:Uncharacterized protein n=1 Tax=Tuber magnatum TaxID=42249 RepID=A0A317SNB6_9PEZI|nr:hypothetical protein C7212DRAFT_320376 [Tuber magnatum]
MERRWEWGKMKKGEKRKGEWYRPRIEGGGGRLAGSSKERLEEERKKVRERMRRKREKEREIRKLLVELLGRCLATGR